MTDPGRSRLIVVFDGHCGMCTRAADRLRRLDRHGRLELVAAQAPGALERLGITETEAQARLWAVHPSGARVGGAGAVLAAGDAALGMRWGSRLYSSPLRRALDAGYAWVAANRRRFPGTTPWCETHACSPAADAAGCAAPALGCAVPPTA